MKSYHNLLFLVLCLVLTYSTANAQGENSDNFVGVWTPTNDFWIKKIKITHAEGKYTIQLKTEDDVKTCKDVKVGDNALYCSFFDETEYGRWVLRYNATVGKLGFEIMANDGSKYGRVDEEKIYNSNGIARYHKDYYSFKVVLKEGNLNVYFGYTMKFYSSTDELLFISGPNYSNTYWTFTDW